MGKTRESRRAPLLGDEPFPRDVWYRYVALPCNYSIRIHPRTNLLFKALFACSPTPWVCGRPVRERMSGIPYPKSWMLRKYVRLKWYSIAKF